MKRIIFVIVVAMICSCDASADISVLPSSSTLSVGGSTSANVSVAGLADLYAFQFDITFNPAVLSVVSVTEGSLFSSVGIFFSPGTIDNTAGTITFIGDSLSGPGPGISADGVLAQVLFNAIGPGSSNLDLSNVVLLDSGLNDIAATASGAAVTVTSTPEPSMTVLLSVGLAVLVVLRHRGRKRGIQPSAP